MVAEMVQRFSGLKEKGCVVVGLEGLNAQDATHVRGMLASKGARMMVVRNRLFSIALERLGVPELKGLLEGPTAVVTGEDPVETARAAREAVEGVSGLAVLGGYAEGRVLDPSGVGNLAELPSRDTLLAQTLACMCSPAQRFAGCLAGIVQRLASVLVQVRDRKRQQEEAGQ